METRIAENIRAYRKQRGLTQEQLAEVLGVSVGAVYKWESRSLAYVFFISGMIEAWGRGFDKIRHECNSLYETPMPEYSISDDGVMVHCLPNHEYLRILRADRIKIDESIMSRFRADEQETVLWIMDMFSGSDSITSSEIRKKLGRPKASVARLLGKMCNEGLLQVIGAGRATKYQKSNHSS